jgi:Leucine-rich repeat (LRR) protein
MTILYKILLNVLKNTENFLFIIAFSFLLNPVFSQKGGKKISIPDVEFENFLISKGYDTNRVPDGYVMLDSLKSIKKMELSSLKIQDLSGIEYFENLEEITFQSLEINELNLSKNKKLLSIECIRNTHLEVIIISTLPHIESLTVSGNKNLKSLDIRESNNIERLVCYYDQNFLIALDISHLSKLKFLDCSMNKITSLDLTHNLLLEHLNCSGNPLKNLDLSQNHNLDWLSCTFCDLTDLDISKNTKLKRLDCSVNKMTKLEVSNNINLESLSIERNKLENLDLLSLVNLYFLNCSDNKLKDLDISSLVNLEFIDCNDNQLSQLDLTKNPKLEGLTYYNYNTHISTTVLVSDRRFIENYWIKSGNYTNFRIIKDLEPIDCDKFWNNYLKKDYNGGEYFKKQALNKLKALLYIGENCPIFYEAQIQLLYKIGSTEEIETAIKQYLDKKPDNEGQRLNLMELYIINNRIEEALSSKYTYKSEKYKFVETMLRDVASVLIGKEVDLNTEKVDKIKKFLKIEKTIGWNFDLLNDAIIKKLKTEPSKSKKAFDIVLLNQANDLVKNNLNGNVKTIKFQNKEKSYTEYNKMGNKIEEYIFGMAKGIYFYDEWNRKISEEYRTFNGTLIQKITFNYENGKVVETSSYDGLVAPEEISTDISKQKDYNKNGDVVLDKRTLNGEVNYEVAYQYKYDKQKNWIERTITTTGKDKVKTIEVEKREITYY